MSSPKNKKIDPNISRQKFFEESRFEPENQKFGLFSFPGTLAISNSPYFDCKKPRKNQDGTVEVGPKNFLTSKPKHGKTPDAFFSSPEYRAEKYTVQQLPFKTDKERAELMKKKHQEAWRPSGSIREQLSLFEHKPSGAGKAVSKKTADGSVKTDPRNFYTSPGKKGNNTPGVLIGGYPEHEPDPYDRKESKSYLTIVRHDAPFRNVDCGGGVFNKDQNVFGGDFKAKSIKTSVSARMLKHDSPFRSTSVGKERIGKFPEYMPDPLPEVKRKNKAEIEPWRSTTVFRSSPSPTVTGNYKNLRQEFTKLRK